MQCRHLADERYSLCTVVRGGMIPSLSEIVAYCTTNPCRCPLYRCYEASHTEVYPESATALFAAGDAADAIEAA